MVGPRVFARRSASAGGDSGRPAAAAAAAAPTEDVKTWLRKTKTFWSKSESEHPTDGRCPRRRFAGYMAEWFDTTRDIAGVCIHDPEGLEGLVQHVVKGARLAHHHENVVRALLARLVVRHQA